VLAEKDFSHSLFFAGKPPALRKSRAKVFVNCDGSHKRHMREDAYIIEYMCYLIHSSRKTISYDDNDRVDNKTAKKIQRIHTSNQSDGDPKRSKSNGAANCS